MDAAVSGVVRRWAREAGEKHENIVPVCTFRSYATGNWGVGSDIDIDVVVIPSESRRPFSDRVLDWDTLDLPVPADLLLYTAAEWEMIKREPRRIARQPIVWVLN